MRENNSAVIGILMGLLVFLIGALVIVLVNSDTKETLEERGFLNVRQVSPDYYHYEVLDGDNLVTCRAYADTTTLACWPYIEKYPDEGF